MKENIDIFVLCVLLKFYMSKCICFSATNKSLSLVKATPPEDEYLKLCLLGNRKALLSQIQKNNEGQNPISRSTVKRQLLAVVSGEKKGQTLGVGQDINISQWVARNNINNYKF